MINNPISCCKKELLCFSDGGKIKEKKKVHIGGKKKMNKGLHLGKKKLFFTLFYERCFSVFFFLLYIIYKYEGKASKNCCT